MDSLLPAPHDVRALAESLVSSADAPVHCANWPDSEAACMAFCTSPTPQALFVAVHDEQFSIYSDIADASAPIRVVLLKLGPLAAVVPLSAQITIFNLPDLDDWNDSYERVRHLLTLAVSPYFDHVLQSNDGTSIARKKFHELTLSLRQLQQQIQVPDLVLSLSVSVRELLRDASSEPDLEDTVLLNELTSSMNTWIKQIQSITTLTRNPSDGGSIQDEIQFWKSMESALSAVLAQTSLPEVSRALEILNAAKRFQVTLAFQNNLGLAEKLDETKVYNALLKDLPIADISFSKEHATDVAKFEAAVVSLFNHLKRWKNLNTFPLVRMIKLIELLVNEIVQHLVVLLSSLNLMALPLTKFISEYNDSLLHLIDTIEANVKFMVNIIRELMRRRQEKFMIVKINQTSLTALREHLDHLYRLKLKHEELITILARIHEDDTMTDVLSVAYSKHIVASNSFDFSKQGASIWEGNQNQYLEVHSDILSSITSMLNRRFDSCATFTDFTSLFRGFQNSSRGESTYPFIIALVEDKHKLRILEVVHNDVQQLMKLQISVQDQFQISGSTSFDGPLARKVWDSALQAKFNYYLHNLAAYLGENWNKYSLGSKIEEEIRTVLDKGKAQDFLNEWERGAMSLIEHSHSKGTVLQLVRGEEDSDRLIVNFDEKLHAIILQAEDLLSLGFELPVNLLIQLDRIKVTQPLAMSLAEHIEMLESLVADVLVNTDFGVKYGFLLESQKDVVSSQLEKVLVIPWSEISLELALLTSDLESIPESPNTCLRQVKMLQEEIYKLYAQSNAIDMTYHHIHKVCYPELLQCSFDAKEITKNIQLIQDEVFKVAHSTYNDLDRFVTSINDDIASLLAEKCTTQLSRIVEELDGSGVHSQRILSPAVHLILFENQSFFLTPLLETTKLHWIEAVNSLFSTVELQQTVSLTSQKSAFLPAYSELLEHQVVTVLRKIDTIYYSATAYYDQWLGIQELLAMDIELPDLLRNIIGEESSDSVESWISAVSKVLEWRKIIDDAGTAVKFGDSLEIVYSQIQSRVSAQLDAFQMKLFNRFMRCVHEETLHLSEDLSNAQKVLTPEVNLQTEIIGLLKQVAKICSYEAKQEPWKACMKSLRYCQLLLHRKRVRLPADWVYVEQLEGQLSNVKALVTLRKQAIEDNLEFFTSKIKTESSRSKEAMSSLMGDWNRKKPVSGSLEPSLALANLANFQKRCNGMKEHAELLCSVASSLHIDIELQDSVALLQEELDDLKYVWSAIQSLWDSLEDLKAQKWNEIHPRGLKHQLEDLLTESRLSPAKVRQYSAFDELQNGIKSFLKDFGFFSELRGASMKERHWKKIFQIIGRNDLTHTSILVGDVLSLNLQLNENLLRNVINQANSEQIIEEGLLGIEQEWSVIVFETFNYEGKCRLIKNWNKLFEQCNDNLSSLASMKNSMFHGQFEKKRTDLEDRLNKLLSLLNLWIEVQRQWVYLDGVFGSSSEIKASLPVESSRFNNVSYEFIQLLKRVNSFNLVIDVLTIPAIQGTMEKFSHTLIRTRKGLAEYLERQRERFPRFYFVGNEDLLELIGGGKDMIRINKHLKLMFPGIESVDYSSESSSIIALTSPEGERLELKTPVSLIKHHELTQWLAELEIEIRMTLSALITESIKAVELLSQDKDILLKIGELIEITPNQVLVVAFQVYFARRLGAVMNEKDLSGTPAFYTDLVKTLATLTGRSTTYLGRRKIESLIIEIIHHRDIVDTLRDLKPSERMVVWNTQQLVFHNPNSKDSLLRLTIKQGRFEFNYGFEYQGVIERLAFTPLIDKCFLSMTQALAQKLGGSPFGPAGTGKTESIKALGHNLGRMVMVFCCDDQFDFQSMGRIFLGLCKVGCWGCFDEFNRLDPKILSALSSQIENIESGLKGNIGTVEISGRQVEVNADTGIFVTMNPGYVGRNELPENLKKLFRSFSMEQPDREIITDVILTSQGFEYSKEISARLIPFFEELEAKSSNQPHYDFGLRTLKSILNKCGTTKRKSADYNGDAREIETRLIYRCLRESIVPKLVREDENILHDLLNRHFPGVHDESGEYEEFIKSLRSCAMSNGITVTQSFIEKALQILQIQDNHHGFMLVGEAGSGKTTLYKHVLSAMSELQGEAHQCFVIDCKVMSKDDLYGSLDLVTRDWTDGLFTKILRSIIANLRGEKTKRTWIVLDGDIDPEWAENLNSVLDDNKMLTLPNGERLELPSNVRIVFEVDNLRSTTLATISRCGMVWFERSLVDSESLWTKFLHELKHKNFDNSEQGLYEEDKRAIYSSMSAIADNTMNHRVFEAIFDLSGKLNHIMEFDEQRGLNAFFTYFSSHCSRLLEHKVRMSDSSLDDLSVFVSKALLLSLIWSFAGDCPHDQRGRFSEEVSRLSEFQASNSPGNLFEYDISLSDFEWQPWSSRVEVPDFDPHQVMDTNTIVPTMDTVSHEHLIRSIINSHSPLILCGPPGSGKTMTLLRALRQSPDLDVISLNFSKDTTPETLLAMLKQHCEYRKSVTGVSLSPKVTGKWVVVFCDEINLPAVDKYGTQRVISFIRHMVENGGFWETSDGTWVSLENIQFVGACNDPNDPGRNRMTDRFMRHVCLVMVDYPGQTSMKQIYQSFNLATLKCAPNLKGFAEAITDAMLQVYYESKLALTPEKRSHYIYSPRELTRWCRGILETMMTTTYSEISALVRLWFHEGLRLFFDRLVEKEEKVWCKDLFWRVSEAHFPHVNLEIALKEPVLFSTWLTLQYEPVKEEELRPLVKERLRVYSEEEMDVNLILFEDLLDHALRIDRVLRQHQGHMILVGPSSSGKTTLTKFVAWMNGLKVVQLKVHSGFTIENFDDILRDVLLCCVKGEKICFLVDESSILETSFIERMNTLLANSEIPGLFEGEDLASLFKLCATEAAAQGSILDSDEELYEWFTKQISENLHVVFTIGDDDKGNRPQVNSSPALFNRCVLSWMGDWSDSSLAEVAASTLLAVPLDLSSYEVPPTFDPFVSSPVTNFRDAIGDALVFIHRSNKPNSLGTAPYHFINCIELFVQLFTKSQLELEENQRHTNIGLDKLRETVLEVTDMKKILSEKKQSLLIKDEDAKKMLNRMIVDQNEAERKREFSLATQVELEKQEVEINARRSTVMQDLEYAEPAILEAQRGVQNIKKQHLTEMRSMSNPPAAVKMAMESVCVLLGFQVTTWRDVQLIVRKDDFIASIVSYNNEKQLTQEMREYMEEVYLSRSDYNYEAINRASKACGPLLQWVIAQLRYSTILDRIGPLREEVAHLEVSATKSRAHLIAIAEMIDELEESIENYKESYSELIRGAERIKSEINKIEEKLNRSLKLIENLTNERQRWKADIQAFEVGRERIIGNSILGAAFTVYSGNLNQADRGTLVSNWKQKLTASGIAFNDSMSITSLLAARNDIITWAGHGLSMDDLFVENFAIKAWCKTPYIIDPTGTILDVLVQSQLPKRVTVTSFHNESFVKQVEDALRFGGTILIDNAESYNPILDSILRQEISQSGGRKTVRIGAKTVDILDEFHMILYTKDSRVDVLPFVASRTTTLNFTITSSNLENQVLNLALQHVRPDMFIKRNELLALQGEYHSRLLNLRKLLLTTLNEVSGKILESDHVIESLEVLESESSDIDARISESETVMTTVDEVRYKHSDLAKHSKLIFNVLLSMSQLSSFYNFSLASFIEIFLSVMRDFTQTLDMAAFLSKLYSEVFALLSPTLIHIDKIAMAVCMATSYYIVEIGPQIEKGVDMILQKNLSGYTDSDISTILSMCFIESNGSDLPPSWNQLCASNVDNDSFRAISCFIEQLITPKTHVLMDAYDKFTTDIVGSANQSKYDLADWIALGKVPILLSTSENFDVTFKVDQIAVEENIKLTIVSMGSKEGVESANKEIDGAIMDGSWVLIQNVHLSPSWLTQLERKLEGLQPHQSFRLFLTCNLDSTDIPSGILASSKIVTYESSPVFRDMLLESFNTMMDLKSVHQASAYKHICFLLSWYHTLIQERLRYVPISFSRRYDINDADLAAVLHFFNAVFSSFERRANVDPSLIPWHELSFVVGEIIYGGKISNAADASFCIELAKQVLSGKSYDAGFSLVANSSQVVELKMPEGNSLETYREWILNLPEKVPLSWIGLSEDVSIEVRQREAEEVAKNVLHYLPNQVAT